MPASLYLGGIIIITFLVSWFLVNNISKIHVGNWYYYLFISFVIIAASQIAASIVNWLSTLLARPCLLPQMDFSKGVPDDSKTLVVVPVLTDNIAALSHMLQSLEVRFLANRDKNIYFSLLVDFNWRQGYLSKHKICNYAGCRYATSKRVCVEDDRHHGTSIKPANIF